MENAFDDSFMDEALFESQILPMLIHAECKFTTSSGPYFKKNTLIKLHRRESTDC